MVLDTAIGEALDLAAMRPPLARQVSKAQTFLDRAEERCAAVKRGPAKRNLRKVSRRVSNVRRILRSRHARRTVPAELIAPLVGAAEDFVGDTRMLGTRLDCR